MVSDIVMLLIIAGESASGTGQAIPFQAAIADGSHVVSLGLGVATDSFQSSCRERFPGGCLARGLRWMSVLCCNRGVY